MSGFEVEEFPREESARAAILRCRVGGVPEPQTDDLAREEPLEIRIGGRNIAVTMRTPGHDKELAAGFLLSEGIIRRAEDISDMADSQGCEVSEFKNIIDVTLAPGVELDLEKLTRHVFASSSCGVCGKASIDAVRQNFPVIAAENLAVSLETIARLPATLREAQATFARTGGLHAAAIFDGRGKLLVLREDVGRHNALDKVIGHGLLRGPFPFDEHVLLVSGRASFEIMQKALAARIPIVCAVSAPSSLAVEFARENGQTLVGFLRGETMNIYAHAGRIAGAGVATSLRGAVAVAR
ncbi:MAG TPA: formate dehydrogenase accessory sulfurtransferase FdhD [Chthoniobacteraceae bacterium]|nr:formate dehydrogenase accessory sulfurtransferase FdhD [Chthoniobacteraceae bacterium]